MLADFNLPIGWRELFKRTLKETQADNVGLDAQLAYFFLALFPALIVIGARAAREFQERAAARFGNLEAIR